MNSDDGHYATIAAALAGHIPAEAAIGAVEALPPGSRYRGVLAMAVIERVLPREATWRFAALRRLDALVGVVDADPPPGDSWRRLRAAARATALAAAAAVQDLPDPTAALAEIDRLRAEVPDDDRTAPLLDSAGSALLCRRGSPFVTTRCRARCGGGWRRCSPRAVRPSSLSGSS